jgi:hypothetical protein
MTVKRTMNLLGTVSRLRRQLFRFAPAFANVTSELVQASIGGKCATVFLGGFTANDGR